MRKDLKSLRNSLGLMAGLCLVVAALMTGIPAAQAAGAKQYYVEFRSRSALSYGHTYLVFGKLNGRGEIGQISANQVAGLSPVTENPWPWMVGHVVPVPSATGATDGDTEEQYITARFRVLLTKDEYDKDVAYIKDHQKNSPMWHAVLYNCNAWVGDVAKFMGLKVPTSSLVYPEEYIEGMAKLNDGKVQPVRHVSRPASPKPAAAQQKPTGERVSAAQQVQPQAR